MKASATKPKPVHVARCNAVRVTVYRNGPARYGITWRSVEHGPRIRETFGARAAAVARADAIALALHNGRAEVLTLTHADRENYQSAIAALLPLGIPLHAAIAEYTAARKALGTHGLSEAVAHFRSSHIGAQACPPVREIVADILGKLESSPVHPRTAGYLRTIRPRLAAIAAAFPSLTDATHGAVEAFLHGLRFRGRPISAKTFNHYRGAFALVWQWAHKRRHITGPTPLSSIPPLNAPGKREVYAAAEMRALLAAADQDWIPFLVLGAFAGLRPCEAARLSWTDLVWEQGEIRIPEHVAGKCGAPRNVPMTEPLRAWLAPYRNRIGRIYTSSPARFHRQLNSFIGKLHRTVQGFRWKANALRHSFGSYHVATHRSLELTRTIMGTGIAMLRHHYNNPQFRADADAYWKILPASAGRNVIAIG